MVTPTSDSPPYPGPGPAGLGPVGEPTWCFPSSCPAKIWPGGPLGPGEGCYREGTDIGLLAGLRPAGEPILMFSSPAKNLSRGPPRIWGSFRTIYNSLYFLRGLLYRPCFCRETSLHRCLRWGSLSEVSSHRPKNNPRSRNNASRPEIGFPGWISAGLLPGRHRNRPSGQPSAGRRADFDVSPAVRPKILPGGSRGFGLKQ